MRRIMLLLAPLLLAAPARAAGDDHDKLLSWWVQLRPGGAEEARAVVDGPACPLIVSFKGAEERTDAPMTMRAAASADFPMVCSGPVPADAHWSFIAMDKVQGDGFQFELRHAEASAALIRIDPTYMLPGLRPDPQRILVLGDTGCRLKDSLVQACNDPKQWPFAGLAAAAAKLRPDLVIHVGDYLYRETPCPDGNAGCAGSPSGDNWASWSADFFAPGAPLLHAAPWVIVRGNHEDCARSAPGFMRVLGPEPYDGSCPTHLKTYDVPLQGLNLRVMDNADAPDTSVDPSVVPEYAADFAALANAPTPTWLVMHRPIWAAIKGPLGIPVGGNQTMIAALAGKPIPPPVSLMLAGHIHAFETLNYKDSAPPTLLAGNGGDLLDDPPSDLKGTIFQRGDVSVKDGLSVPGFGFLLMTRHGTDWEIDLFDAAGTFERRCMLAGGRIDCPAPPAEKKDG
ncbi:MAG TPA: metallophosphoesterase [Rhizomicrobium sp.]|nr:metallophosphoesterase [Rhizomicrobium sp.]